MNQEAEAGACGGGAMQAEGFSLSPPLWQHPDRDKSGRERHAMGLKSTGTAGAIQSQDFRPCALQFLDPWTWWIDKTDHPQMGVTSCGHLTPTA